jgi:hypothetical protein
MTRSILRRALLAGTGLAAVLALASCSDYDNVSVHGSVGMYYGAGGYYDPWYYGPRYGGPVIVAPPPSRPRPEHPIARPPPARPTPYPSRPAPVPARPSTRPMPRGR